MKLIKACIALAAFAAIFVVPSVASATLELTHPTGTTIPEGTNIIGTNVKHDKTELTTIMKTSIGNVECETATLTGEITKNSGGVVEGNITTAEFRGTPKSGGGDENTNHCAGGFGGATSVTPSHTVNPEHNGVKSLPWCLKAGAEDTFSVRGGKCSEASRALTFTLHTATIGSCSYQKVTALTGIVTTHPNDLIATVNGGENAKFVKTTGSAFCPASGELFMAFTLTTDLGVHPGPPVVETEGGAIYLDK